ncbi:MAG: Flp pilus assembly protein CpaB [Verrucomicrobiota bacterium]
MNKAFNFLIIAALLLGVVSIFLIVKYVDLRVQKASQAAPTKEIKMDSVVVAKEPITIGSSFTQFNTQIKSMPEDFVPASAIKSFDELNGKIAMHDIPVNDILFNAKVGTPTALPKASAVIPAGKRLVTIGVDDQSAAGFTVKNGDFVDLVGIFEVSEDLLEREDEPIGGSLSVTFLQKVEVFDIIHGQTSVPSPDNNEDTENPDAGRLAQGTTATFVVTPQEAEIILGATRASDSVYMLLRRYDDEAIIEQPSTLHERIATRLTGDLAAPVDVDTGPVVAPVEPKKKIVF